MMGLLHGGVHGAELKKQELSDAKHPIVMMD